MLIYPYRNVCRLIEAMPARLALAWLAVSLLGVGTSELQGQTNRAVDVALSGEQTPQIKIQLAAAQEDFTRALVTATNLPPGATATEFIEYRLAQQQLVRSYQFQLDDLAAVEAPRPDP